LQLPVRPGGGGGLPPADAAHRYWVVQFPRNNGSGSFLTLDELAIYDIGALSTNIIGSATLTATPTLQAGSTAALKDGVLNSFAVQWNYPGSPSTSNVSTIKIDFGVGVAKDIARIGIARSSVDNTRTPIEAIIAWSDDDVTYTESWRASRLQTLFASSNVLYTVDRPAWNTPIARWWRIRRPDYVNVIACVECELRIAYGGTDQTGSGTAYASDTFGSLVPANAFDNNTATIQGNGDLRTPWLGYDFGSGNDCNIIEFKFTARNDGNHLQTPPTGFVDNSADGFGWRTQWTFTGSAYTSGEARVVSKP
jgi:hypothetical protein